MWSSRPGRHTGPAWPGVLFLLVGIWLGGAACAAAPAVPDSLGQWYKPQNKRQVWLHTMFAMRRELQAVREYAAAGDAERMTRWAERLAAHYRKLTEMVPEWRDETDASLLDELNREVAAADFAAVDRAADRLENDCRSCHREYQALAALRYRWPRFSELQIDDGHGGTHVYGDHMEILSRTLNRIKIASEDDRWKAATQAHGDLRGQLDRLGENCQVCHKDDAPRERILGADTTATLQQLDQALLARDRRAVGRRLGEAAVKACARCHSVHRMLSEIQRHLFE